MRCGLRTCSSAKQAANTYEVFWKVPALGDNCGLVFTLSYHSLALISRNHTGSS